jgi:hypothetical protein
MNRRRFLLMEPVVMMGAVLPIAFFAAGACSYRLGTDVAWIVGDRVLKMIATPYSM